MTGRVIGVDHAATIGEDHGLQSVQLVVSVLGGGPLPIRLQGDTAVLVISVRNGGMHHVFHAGEAIQVVVTERRPLTPRILEVGEVPRRVITVRDRLPLGVHHTDQPIPIVVLERRDLTLGIHLGDLVTMGVVGIFRVMIAGPRHRLQPIRIIPGIGHGPEPGRVGADPQATDGVVKERGRIILRVGHRIHVPVKVVPVGPSMIVRVRHADAASLRVITITDPAPVLRRIGGYREQVPVGVVRISGDRVERPFDTGDLMENIIVGIKGRLVLRVDDGQRFAVSVIDILRRVAPGVGNGDRVEIGVADVFFGCPTREVHTGHLSVYIEMIDPSPRQT